MGMHARSLGWPTLLMASLTPAVTACTETRSTPTAVRVDAGNAPTESVEELNARLIEAVDRGVAGELLARGVDPNARAADTRTPIMRASHAQVLKMLLDAGANVGAFDEDGRDALMHLFLDPGRVERKSQAHMLASADIDLARTDRFGATSVEYAARAGDGDSVNLLLFLGAPAVLSDRAYAALAMTRAGTTSRTIVVVRPRISREKSRPQLVYDEAEVRFDDLDPEVVTIALELGESVPGRRVTVIAPDGVKVSMQERSETSVSISDEGPHLDLTEWRHGYTPWSERPEVVPRIFAAAEGPASCTLPFPPTTHAELAEAIRALGPAYEPERWIVLTGTSADDFDVTRFVGPSAIEWRISVRQGEAFVPVKTIRFTVPMGC